MSWLFAPRESKAQKQTRKQKEREAYLKAYETAKIQSAAKRGKRAGSTTWGDRLSGLGAGLERANAASNRAANTLFGDLGSIGDFGLGGFGSEPPRRKAHKKRKGKTIVIHVK